MASFPHPMGNKTSWPLVFPTFLAEKPPAKGENIGGKWWFGALLLGWEQDGASTGTHGDAGAALTWPSGTHSPMGTLGWGCCIPPPRGPIPSPILRLVDLAQSDANPAGAAGAAGKKGQACSGSRLPRHGSHGALKPRRGPSWKEAGVRAEAWQLPPHTHHTRVPAREHPCPHA